MAALSDAQLWTVVVSQWGTGPDALTAFAIALAESGGDPSAIHRGNADGTNDYGLFQINSVHASLLAGANWQDPTTNAHMGYTLYTAAGNKFSPWSTYKNASYARFLARAQAAAKSGGAPVPSNSASTPAATQSDPNAAAVATATSAGTWQRIGMFLAGGALLLIFMVSVVKNTSVAKTVGHIAKTAVKVAVA